MLRSLEQKKQYGASSRKLHLVEERYMPAVLLELQVGNRNRHDIQYIKNTNREFLFDPDQYYTNTMYDTTDSMHYWAGSNTPETLSGPYFRLPWDCQLKNGYSFVLGTLDPSLSDKSQCSCDFQLADSNASGISRRHMSVDIYEQHNADQRVSVRLNCLSQELIVQTLWPRVHNGTTISARDILKKGEHVPVNRITYDNIAYWVNEITQILPIIEG
ncbi:hypothetical protein ACMFMG_002502 [Clarireedia jacksonii]